MPRDAGSPGCYVAAVQKLLFLSLVAVPLATLFAESIELQDGTKVEGKILSVTAESVLIEVQTSPTIREQKSYPRTDVARIERASQDDLAFAEVAVLAAPPTADNPAVCDPLIERVRTFMKNYPYSKHMPAARKLAATLESDRARLAAGEVKVDGGWSAETASPADRTELGGQVQLSKMKEAGDPAVALAAFDVLEKSHGTSSAYPDAVKLALVSIDKLRDKILRAGADLDRRTAEHTQGLQLASEDRRLQMEAGLAQEKAAVQAQVDRAKQSGVKWLPLLPDSKVLADLSALADSEQARISQIDVQKMTDAVEAARAAKQHLESGDLEGAKARLDDVQRLWPQYVLLAPLQESLKKAQDEAAKQAQEKAKPSAP